MVAGRYLRRLGKDGRRIMAEMLRFIFDSPLHFVGVILLILVSGFALNMALSPFGKPRYIITNVDGIPVELEEEDEDGKNQN